MPDWISEVLLLLQAVHRSIQRDSESGASRFFSTQTATVNDELGRSDDDPRTGAILLELRNTGYISAEFSMGSPPRAPLIRLTERGSQYVAGWPSRLDDHLYPALIASLEERIAHADPDERTSLEKLREGVKAVGQAVVTGVLIDMARRGIRVVTGGDARIPSGRPSTRPFARPPEKRSGPRYVPRGDRLFVRLEPAAGSCAPHNRGLRSTKPKVTGSNPVGQLTSV
jgi:hypothetical protein